MNQYETMFFNNPEELKKKIQSLVEKQLQTKATEKCAELKEISKLIEYSTSINETVSFQSDNPYGSGSGEWSSVGEYLEAKEEFESWCICSQAEAEKQGVDFGGDSAEYGTFDFEGDTEVVITDLWLITDTCSVEAKAKWNEKRVKDIEEHKQKQIQMLEQQLLNLKAEVESA